MIRSLLSRNWSAFSFSFSTSSNMIFTSNTFSPSFSLSASHSHTEQDTGREDTDSLYPHLIGIVFLICREWLLAGDRKEKRERREEERRDGTGECNHASDHWLVYYSSGVCLFRKKMRSDRIRGIDIRTNREGKLENEIETKKRTLAQLSMLMCDGLMCAECSVWKRDHQLDIVTSISLTPQDLHRGRNDKTMTTIWFEESKSDEVCLIFFVVFDFVLFCFLLLFFML